MLSQTKPTETEKPLQCPSCDGRSFGTNVMEALLVASNDGKPLTEAEYMARLRKLNWTPSVRDLQQAKTLL